MATPVRSSSSYSGMVTASSWAKVSLSPSTRTRRSISLSDLASPRASLPNKMTSAVGNKRRISIWICDTISFLLIFFSFLIFRHSRTKYQKQSDNDFSYCHAEEKPKGVAPCALAENGKKYHGDYHARPTGKAAFQQVLLVFGKLHSVEICGKDNKKTPPNGEKGGEKQYKDYEKNPTLFFLNASASKTMQR